MTTETRIFIMKRTYCSLQEAIVWIAFRGEKLTTEEWIKRSDELEPATEMLLKAIQIEAIHATGINSTNGKRTPVTIAPPSIIDYNTNSITYEEDIYYAGELCMPIFTEVEVLIENLKDGFPPKHPIKTANDEYTTPYLEIAKKIIKQEHISDTNQGKKELLVAEIEKEMELQGLPKSKSMADKIATIIRKPESQKGGWKKG